MRITTKYQIILVLGVTLLLFQKGYGQDFFIKGKVVDYESTEALQMVQIVPDNNYDLTATDENGNFVLKGSTHNIRFDIIAHYSLRIKNIPVKNEDINLGDIRMVPYHILEHIVIGGKSPEIPEHLIKQDKKLRKEVLRNYRLKIYGEKLKPYFEGSYLVFDFNNKRGKISQ